MNRGWKPKNYDVFPVRLLPHGAGSRLAGFDRAAPEKKDLTTVTIFRVEASSTVRHDERSSVRTIITLSPTSLGVRS